MKTMIDVVQQQNTIGFIYLRKNNVYTVIHIYIE